MITLRARLSRAQAAECMRGGRLGRWLGRSRSLRGLLEVHVPYRLVRVTVTNGGREQVLWLALDRACGWLDPYHFESPPDDAAPTCPAADGAALLPAVVTLERLRERALECVRREVYRRGFFRLAGLHLSVEDGGREVHVPYWVGLLERGDRITLEVWNAVRRQREGAKLCEVIEHWLASRGALPHAPAVTPR